MSRSTALPPLRLRTAIAFLALLPVLAWSAALSGCGTTGASAASVGNTSPGTQPLAGASANPENSSGSTNPGGGTGGSAAQARRFLYVANNGPDISVPAYFRPSSIQDAISVFAVDSGSSSLTYAGGIPDTDLLHGLNLFASADGTWLFVDSGRADEFHIDRATGALSNRKTLLPADGIPHKILGIDPAAPLLLVYSGYASGNLASYRIASDGSLEPTSSVSSSGLYAPAVFDHSGSFLFSTGQQPAEIQIDPTTGQLSAPRSLPAEFNGLRVLGFDNSNRFLLGALEDTSWNQEIFVFDFDPTTGNVSLRSRGTVIQPLGDHIVLLFFNNVLYARSNGTVMVYRFDPAGAAVSNSGQTFACVRDFNVPFLADKASSSLFMVAAGQNEVESLRVDLNTGQESSRQDYPAGSGPWTMAVSPPQ